MKLIDLLVQELPKRGGWPEGYDVVSTNGYGAVWAYKTKGCTAGRELYFHSTTEGSVTKEQYESALAASQKVEWDGAGMPPIGQRVVFFLNPCFDYDKEIVPPEGTEMEVVAHKKTSDGNEVAVCYWDKNGGGMAVCLVPDSLMPEKSEADKKRDEAIEAIASYALPYKCGADIYDAIAAGKIPGVRIE